MTFDILGVGRPLIIVQIQRPTRPGIVALAMRAVPAAAQNESSIKAAYVLNRDGAPGFSWRQTASRTGFGVRSLIAGGLSY